MAYVPAVDISQYQTGDDYSEPIIIMKASGGDAGLYFDSRCTLHYNNAKSKGKAIGLYHFAGATNPTTEADFFVKACSPLEQNDVLVLDWEVSHPDPVGWCLAFTTRVHDLTGVWCLLYLNLSTLRAHDWTPVTKNSGLWIAAWGADPNGTLNTGGYTYVMHQYRGAPLDLDAWFGTVEQFKKYGYQAPKPVPVPAPAPIPAPIPTPAPVPVPPPDYGQENNSLLKQILSIVKAILDKLTSVFK